MPYPIDARPTARPTPARSRRTQAERRATTREALLEATIAGLVEYGYARLTTAQIVDSAGVTRGAQAHHFSTKADLVAEALAYLAEKIGADLVAHPPPPADTPHGQFAALLDRWWEVFSGEMFLATAELWVAARTDAELREALAGFAHRLNSAVVEQSAELAPMLLTRPDHRSLVVTALSSITGLALVRIAAGDKAVDLMWERTRSELLRLVP